jgi:hypothetical protein
MSREEHQAWCLNPWILEVWDKLCQTAIRVVIMALSDIINKTAL